MPLWLSLSIMVGGLTIALGASALHDYLEAAERSQKSKFVRALMRVTSAVASIVMVCFGLVFLGYVIYGTVMWGWGTSCNTPGCRYD